MKARTRILAMATLVATLLLTAWVGNATFPMRARASTSGAVEKLPVLTNSTSALPVGVIPFKEAIARIEFNSTGEDLGFHVELDADAWKQATIFSPNGSKLFKVKNQGSVGKQGLTHLAFESAEPTLAQLPLDKFLARFPEGVYTVVGETIKGETLMSPMTLTHDIPAPPMITSPGEGEVVSVDAVVIDWEPVTSPAGIEIVLYQLFLFPADPPVGQSPPALNIDFTLEVPTTVTRVRIPPELLEPGIEYKFEVKAIEAGGNQTVTEGLFKTK